jgi:hypothetical protein
MFEPAQIGLVANATLAMCDLLDGISDGIISNADASHFNPRPYDAIGQRPMPA